MCVGSVLTLGGFFGVFRGKISYTILYSPDSQDFCRKICAGTQERKNYRSSLLVVWWWLSVCRRVPRSCEQARKQAYDVAASEQQETGDLAIRTRCCIHIYD